MVSVMGEILSNSYFFIPKGNAPEDYIAPILSVVCVLLVLVILWGYRMYLKTNLRLDDLADSFDEMSDEIEESLSESDSMHTSIGAFDYSYFELSHLAAWDLRHPLADRNASVETLLFRYFLRTEQLIDIAAAHLAIDKGNKTVIESLNHEFAAISTTDNWKILLNAINECRNRMVDRLDRIMPDLIIEDRLLIAFNAFGVTARAAAKLIGLSEKGYYARRARLFKRIEDTPESDDRNRIIELLETYAQDWMEPQWEDD